MKTYNAFIAILMQGIKEQSKAIDSLSKEVSKENTKTNKQDSINTYLKNQISQFASIIDGCCKTNHDNGNHNGGNHAPETNPTNEPNDSQRSVLEQNVPNPFNQQTSIQYFIPTTAQSASIMIFDLNGKLMKTIPIINFGSNAITINGNELNPGMFVYTLVVDRKIIDTKRMILTQ